MKVADKEQLISLCGCGALLDALDECDQLVGRVEMQQVAREAQLHVARCLRWIAGGDSHQDLMRHLHGRGGRRRILDHIVQVEPGLGLEARSLISAEILQVVKLWLAELDQMPVEDRRAHVHSIFAAARPIHSGRLAAAFKEADDVLSRRERGWQSVVRSNPSKRVSEVRSAPARRVLARLACASVKAVEKALARDWGKGPDYSDPREVIFDGSPARGTGRVLIDLKELGKRARNRKGPRSESRALPALSS